MRKALRIMAILAAFGLTAWIGVVALAQSSPQAPTTSTTLGTGDDGNGNCGEAEHANDPECLGTIPVAQDNEAADDNDDQGENENADDNGDEGNNDQADDEGNDNNSADPND